MEAGRFGIMCELIDELKKGREGLKHAVAQAELQSWTNRLDALGNVEDEIYRLRKLTEYGLWVGNGLTEAVNILVLNLETTKTLLELMEKIGDLEQFRRDLTLLQESAEDADERTRTHEQLKHRGFSAKLAAFEHLIETAASITFHAQEPDEE